MFLDLQGVEKMEKWTLVEFGGSVLKYDKLVSKDLLNLNLS